jgi:MoaA/NifB/PqqE/SkfB family radical SAM enzyme
LLYDILYYSLPQIASSQIAHSATLPLKLGCGTRCVSLRFNIIVLYRTIYTLSTSLSINISMLRLSDIRQVQIELTTRCNARCPMCMRNYRGMDFNSGYPETELSLQQLQHILPPDFLRQLTYGVIFNGNLGDFGLARDAKKIVHWLADQNVPIMINTNGSMRTPEWWAELARPRVRIGWALDGLADTHALYRQDTNWHDVIENARAFISAGGQAIWRFIPFDHNRHQEAACRQLAQDMGFSYFENIDEGRNRGPVYKRTGEFSHWLGKPYTEYERQNPPPVRALLESHITWFDPKTVNCEKDTQPLDLICQHKRQQEIYIAADGTVWPCCFLGFYPATMSHPGNQQLLPLVAENNALDYDLAHCMAWFERVEETWAKNSIAEGRLYGCVNSCGGRNV